MPGKFMIVHINSYPGVGKLTIGRLLAERLGAKLLDNHSMCNVAFALSELNSPAFCETVRAVRETAYALVLDLPAETPVILTNGYSQGSPWGIEKWEAVIALARKRGCPCSWWFCPVHRRKRNAASKVRSGWASASREISRWSKAM